MYLPLAATYLFMCLPCMIMSVLAYRGLMKWSKLLPSISLIVSLGWMALSAGLSSNFDATTSTSSVLGLEVLFSAGAGIGALRFALPQSIMWPLFSSHPMDCHQSESVRGLYLTRTMMIRMECLGGAIGIAAAQAVFVSKLTRASLNDQEVQLGSLILHSGATNFKHKLRGDVLDAALGMYNNALTRTFFVATTAGALPTGFIGFMAIPPFIFFYFLWRRLKKGTRGKPRDVPQTGVAPSLPQHVIEKIGPGEKSPSGVLDPQRRFASEMVSGISPDALYASELYSSDRNSFPRGRWPTGLSVGSDTGPIELDMA
jgi:hypothetical protein